MRKETISLTLISGILAILVILVFTNHSIGKQEKELQELEYNLYNLEDSNELMKQEVASRRSQINKTRLESRPRSKPRRKPCVSSDGVIRTIEFYAKEYNVDTELALRIADAESSYNPNAKNPKSTASGLYQFIKSTWQSTLKRMDREWVSPFDADTNIEAAIYLLAQGELHHWNASKNKWN